MIIYKYSIKKSAIFKEIMIFEFKKARKILQLKIQGFSFIKNRGKVKRYFKIFSRYIYIYLSKNIEEDRLEYSQYENEE